MRRAARLVLGTGATCLVLAACSGPPTGAFGPVPDDPSTGSGSSSGAATGSSSGASSGATSGVGTGAETGASSGTMTGTETGAATGAGTGSETGVATGTPTGDPNCASCAEFINGSEQELCGAEMDGCMPNSSCALFFALLECACQGCPIVCSETCNGMGMNLPSCDQCLQGQAVSPGCSGQLSACQNDPG